MALNPSTIYSDLVTVRAAGPFPFLGSNFDRLAWALGFAVTRWFSSGGVLLQGVSSGTAGAGAINVPTTRLSLPPAPQLVVGGLATAGMVGPLSLSLGVVVSAGLSRSVSTSGQYTGGVVGVGVGADITKAVSANGQALTSLLLPYIATFLGPGPAAPQMAAGLGTGIALHALTIIGGGSVVGPPSVVPAGGTSTGIIV